MWVIKFLLLDLGHLNVASTIFEIDRNALLEEYLSEFGERVLEVHISENHGLKDEHLPVKSNSWQLDAIKKIKQIAIKNHGERHYCVEAKNASEAEIKESLFLINELVA